MTVQDRHTGSTDDRPSTSTAGPSTTDGGGRTDGPARDAPPPDAAEDPAVCSSCGARFVDDELLALHRGLDHGSELGEAERAAYREARASEREDLRLFRLQALVALLVIYFGFVLLYAFVL